MRASLDAAARREEVANSRIADGVRRLEERNTRLDALQVGAPCHHHHHHFAALPHPCHQSLVRQRSLEVFHTPPSFFTLSCYDIV